jgi:hypothetical protein
MPTRRLVSRIDVTDTKRGLREAERLLEECASKGGSPYVEKVSPTVVEVGCTYEAPEEAVVTTSPKGEKYEYRDLEVVLPTDLSSPSGLAAARESLRKMEQFINECRSKGGEVWLSKSAKSVDGNRVPSVVVTCARRVLLQLPAFRPPPALPPPRQALLRARRS